MISSIQRTNAPAKYKSTIVCVSAVVVAAAAIRLFSTIKCQAPNLLHRWRHHGNSNSCYLIWKCVNFILLLLTVTVDTIAHFQTTLSKVQHWIICITGIVAYKLVRREHTPKKYSFYMNSYHLHFHFTCSNRDYVSQMRVLCSIYLKH